MSEPTSTPRRGGSILLIVSLCLNVALVGLIAAGIVQAIHNARTPMSANGPLSPHMLMRLAPAEQTKIQAVIDAHQARVAALRLQSVRTRREAFRAFAAADYSADTFAKSLEAVRTADGVLEDEGIKVMAQSIATLTPAERQVVAEHARQQRRSWLGRMFRRRPQ